jgi:hypothetical protein
MSIDKTADEFTEEEAKQRFETALKGASHPSRSKP